MSRKSPTKPHFIKIPHRHKGTVRVWFLEQQPSLLQDCLSLSKALGGHLRLKWRKVLFPSLKRLGKRINQPRVIRIGRTKIIIAILLIWMVWPSPQTVIYAEPNPSPAPQSFTPKHFEPMKAVDLPEAEPAAPIAPSKPVVAKPVTSPPAAAVAGCGDNQYANYIYMHESGCRTNAVGPNGPCGLGQALPCSKLPCSLSDYACQNAWFTQYALSVYKSWENAYNFWLGHHYW